MIAGICLVTENVNDLVTFYTSLLNKEFDGELGYRYIKDESLHMSICDVTIEQNIAPDYKLPSRGGRIIIEITTDEIEVILKRCLDFSFKILKSMKKEPWGITSFWVEDLDGNIISFCQTESL